jgi:hypothetical protein
MRSLKDTVLAAVGRGLAGKVSFSADSVPPNIGYGFQRYFVAEMKREDRRPARTVQGMPPWLFSDGSEAQLSREGLHHHEQRGAKEIEGRSLVRGPKLIENKWRKRVGVETASKRQPKDLTEHGQQY